MEKTCKDCFRYLPGQCVCASGFKIGNLCDDYTDRMVVEEVKSYDFSTSKFALWYPLSS